MTEKIEFSKGRKIHFFEKKIRGSECLSKMLISWPFFPIFSIKKFHEKNTFSNREKSLDSDYPYVGAGPPKYLCFRKTA